MGRQQASAAEKTHNMASTYNFTQRGALAVSAGATSASPTFTAAFVNTPFVVQAQLFSVGTPGSPATASCFPYALTTTGFTAVFNAAIPNDGTQWYLGWEATAQQPTPTSQDGCSTGCGCGGSGNGCGCGCGATTNVAYASPPPVAGAYLFTGAQGIPGPLLFFRGPYDASATYYDNANRVDVVTYAGFYWRANTASKNATASWGTPTVGSGDWLNVGAISGGSLGGYNSYGATANITGNSTVSPASANHTEQIMLGGSAGTRIFAVSASGRNAGDRCWLNFVLPTTAAIVFTICNDTTGGAQLLPSATYPSNAYTTDGVVTSLSVALFFNGSVWQYDFSKSPA